jgi:hypothetical protein
MASGLPARNGSRRPKPRILDAYLARWGYQVRPYFRALPNASDHPVFRIE